MKKSNPHTVVTRISTAIMENKAKASKKNLKLNLTYDLAILLLGIQPKKTKSIKESIAGPGLYITTRIWSQLINRHMGKDSAANVHSGISSTHHLQRYV